MDTYIMLGNFTQQGITTLKETGPARIEAGKKAVEAANGKWIGWYLTMGRYDFVVIAQLPDAATAAKIILSLGALGNVRTETLRAFTEEEYKQLLAGMP